MVTARSGHSLAELVVAMTIMGASLAGMAAVALVGSRRTEEAVALQRAATVAAAVMDSLILLGETPASGRRDPAPPGLVVEWEVQPRADGSSTVVVRVQRPTHPDAMIVLSGLWITTPPGPIP